VQGFPSLQEAPFALAGFEHAPVAGLQLPASWHWSGARQVTGLPPEHVPAWHVSTNVHGLPSSQATPSALGGFEHVPLPGSQVPGAWHWSLAAQPTGVPGTHVPAWHESPCVHALPSLHETPSSLGVQDVWLMAALHA